MPTRAWPWRTATARFGLDRVDVPAAALAGLAAGAAFAVAIEAERRLGGRNLDDLILLGRPLASDPAQARPIGLLLHAGASVALALVYATVDDRFPGPPWWRGALFANLENTLLYPLTAFEDLHPAIRDGQLDHYHNLPAYVQTTPRHLLFGAIVGTLYGRLRR